MGGKLADKVSTIKVVDGKRGGKSKQKLKREIDHLINEEWENN